MKSDNPEDSVPVELDPRRLKAFRRIVEKHPYKRMKREDLWGAFAEAFPGRPLGVEERRWFLAVLENLEEKGVIRIPSRKGRRWDRTLGIAVPTSVDLVGKVEKGRRTLWRTFPWHPRLAWASDIISLTNDQEAFLLKVHKGLVNGWFDNLAPQKYRSLQLTGDEKRLKRMSKTRIFGPGRLDMDVLSCLPEIPPLAWEAVSEGPNLIVFENAGPFTVARKVLSEMAEAPYGLIAYGGGRSFEASVAHLDTIGRPVRKICYVGDLDCAGLQIAIAAQNAAEKAALPPFAPAVELHKAMLKAAVRFGFPLGWPDTSSKRKSGIDSAALVDFLSPDIQEETLRIIQSGRRIPEEVLGPDELLAAWSNR